MKIKNIFGVALATIAAFSLASCSDKVEYTPAEALTNAQVYFPTTDPSSISLDMNATSYSVTLSRVKTDENLTVNLATTITTEGAEDLIKIPSSVTFASGQSSVEIPLTYDGEAIGYDNPISGTITISDASYTTPYGTSSYSFTANIPAPWKTLGYGTYIDHFVGCLYGVDALQYEVEVQENEQVPGYYRLVYPYDGKYGYNDPGDWDTTQTYYLEIHAEDPSKVYITTQKLGMSWSYGMCYASTFAGYYIARGDEADAQSYYGKLENGIITFPDNSYLFGMADYNSGALYYGDGAPGQPFLALPGATIADNSISVVYKGIFTDTSSAAFAVADITLGADVTTAKAVVAGSDDDVEAVAEALADGTIEGTDIVAGENKIPVGDLTGNLQLVAVTIVDGVAKNYASASFEYYGGGSNPWKSLGMAQYTDDFIAPLFGVDPQTYEVEVLENENNPGLYRLVNAYGAAYPLNEEGDYDPNATNYIEIDATDPDGVYFTTQDTGLNWGYGEMYIVSWGGYYYEYGYDLETLKSYGYLGTLKNGVITIPVFEREASDGSTAKYQGLTYLGSNGYYAGSNGAFKIVLPGAAASAKAKKVSKKTHATRRLHTNANMSSLRPIDKKMTLKSSIFRK